MILIVTNKADIHCNPVIKQFISRGDRFFRLNTESLLDDYDLSFWIKDNVPELKIFNKKNSKCLLSSSVTAVWERRPLSPDIRSENNTLITSVVQDEAAELTKWLRHYFHKCRTIGSSIWDRPNESKLRQMDISSKIIKNGDLNIKIPTTLLTNSKSEMDKIITMSNYVVIKPIGSDGIELDSELEMPFVSRKISSELLRKIPEDDIGFCPTFIQAYIDKDYELRVTVVGSKHFCCKIDSQKLPVGKGREDWREGYDYGLPQTWITAPKEIVGFCDSYLEHINSSFGCFDFIRAKDGFYYFLECNPNGQWMWLEEDIGMPISNAIANYLTFRAD